MDATNRLALTLSDAQGRPVSDATVKVSISMEVVNMGEVNATMTGAPIYTASFNANQTFPMEGPWTIQVEVDRPGQQPVQFTFHVVVTQ